jgi:hypothetical protein
LSLFRITARANTASRERVAAVSNETMLLMQWAVYNKRCDFISKEA